MPTKHLTGYADSMSTAKHTPGPLTAVKVEDRSAYNIFAPGYGTAIATVSSQGSAHGCMGSIVTRQYALAMAAGPDLLVYARCEEARACGEDVAETVLKQHGWNPGDCTSHEFMDRIRRAAIAKATGSAA